MRIVSRVDDDHLLSKHEHSKNKTNKKIRKKTPKEENKIRFLPEKRFFFLYFFQSFLCFTTKYYYIRRAGVGKEKERKEEEEEKGSWPADLFY